MKKENKKEKYKELREKLAEIEHQRWADWQKYLHSKIEYSTDDEYGKIPLYLIDGWERQIKTPYSELSEKEKDSDREQVDRYWYLIEEVIKQKCHR